MPGRLIVVSGPSGSGKSTLVRRALAHPGIGARRSVSATTRAPRDGERDGEAYHFLSPEAFRAAIDAGDFLEWAEYAGHLYGTPATSVGDALELGECVVLEIEVRGAAQVRDRFPDALLVWIDTPGFDELERRLRDRAADGPDAMARRLDRAREELEEAGRYDRRLLNDDLDRAVADLIDLLRQHGCGA